MTNLGETQVDKGKVYTTLNQWKEDFLPERIKSNITSDLTDDNIRIKDKHSAETIEKGMLNLQRLFY